MHTGQLWCFAGSLWRVNLTKYFMQGVFVFDDQACSGAWAALSSWPGRTRRTNYALPSPLIRCTHPCSLPPSLSHPVALLLCPLTSINVMVHQWWRTLSRGRTPLLIWLLLMGENTINKFNYPWPISNGGDRIIIHVISEVWIWREIITLVSRYGWTGYVNIFHIHGDELLCIVKAREGVRDTEDEHPLLCPQWPSVLHREGPSSAGIDDWRPSTADSSSSHTNDEDRWIKI